MRMTSWGKEQDSACSATKSNWKRPASTSMLMVVAMRSSATTRKEQGRSVHLFCRGR